MTNRKQQIILFVVTLGFIASMGAVTAKTLQLRASNDSLVKTVQSLNTEAMRQTALNETQDAFHLRMYAAVGNVLTEQQKAALSPKLSALNDEYKQEISRLAKIQD
jgi:serine protease inhibitor